MRDEPIWVSGDPTRLTQILEDAVGEHAPPMVNNRRIKLRYAHLGGANPPIIVIHGNQIEKVPKSYVRYLENTYRRVLKLVGTPIRIDGERAFAPHLSPRVGADTEAVLRAAGLSADEIATLAAQGAVQP